MYKVTYSPQAENALEKLATKTPHIARDILDKTERLAENAEAFKHERPRGTKDFSLHCGQYWIPYL
jgi:mRNA-degrading endonuclease RelE of RelBE toxin-antitoxin system